ncbi:MAG: hypothetical protein ACKVZJ_04465 [Phycisphaerales bacterium]
MRLNSGLTDFGALDQQVDSANLSTFRPMLRTTDPVGDFNGGGDVSTPDLSDLLARFGRASSDETATWDDRSRLVSSVGTTTGSGGGSGWVRGQVKIGTRFWEARGL